MFFFHPCLQILIYIALPLQKISSKKSILFILPCSYSLYSFLTDFGLQILAPFGISLFIVLLNVSKLFFFLIYIKYSTSVCVQSQNLLLMIFIFFLDPYFFIPYLPHFSSLTFHLPILTPTFLFSPYLNPHPFLPFPFPFPSLPSFFLPPPLPPPYPILTFPTFPPFYLPFPLHPLSLPSPPSFSLPLCHFSFIYFPSPQPIPCFPSSSSFTLPTII